MNKDAFYFPHDSNAKDDPKCVLLIDQLGLEGYGIFWMLIETLREQPDYRYPINLLPALARRYNTTAEKVVTVVKSYGLFVVESDKVFFSESLIKRMLPLEDKREKARKSAQLRWDKYKRNANALGAHSDSNAKKKRKEKNILKENKEESPYNPPKEYEKFSFDFLDKDFSEIFFQWINYKSERRNKYGTQGSIKLCYDNLLELSGNNPSIAKQIVKQSMANNWSGLFPIKSVKQDKTKLAPRDKEQEEELLSKFK